MTFAPIDAEYLTLAANGVLTDYRVLALGSMLVAVDGGPAGNYSLNVDPAAVDHNSLDNLTTGNPHTQYMLGTILTANGDILTRVAGSPAALAIGSAGQVLTVSGGAAAWAAPASAGLPGPQMPHISGRYYCQPDTCGAPSTLAVTANRLYLAPLYVPQTASYDRIAVAVAGAAAGNVRLGIYGPFTGSWGSLALVTDAGTVSCGSLGTKTITINQQLTQGWYLTAAVFDNTPTVFAYNGANTLSQAGRADVDSNAAALVLYYAFTYGTLPSPSTTTPTYQTTNGPIVALRAT